MQEREQARLLHLGDLHCIRRAAMLNKKQRFEHEECQESGTGANKEMHKRSLAAGPNFIEPPVCGPYKPASQGNVKRDE
jgi:hypothetical protein